MIRPVLIAGAGPVGMIAAADLVRQGVAVTVLEKGSVLSLESRASTFHPPTLDMLADLGFSESLIAQGLRAPQVQYGSTLEGVLGTFDFGAIADLTRHPFRLQAEQFKLTQIVLAALQDHPLFEIRFGCAVTRASEDRTGVEVELEDGGRVRGEWLIGADGAGSPVRRSLGIPFEGFTWPERFLVVSTTADLEGARPDLATVSYWADPRCWHFYLRIPGAWRIMMPVAPEVSDDQAESRAFAEQSLARVLPPGLPAPIVHVTIYRVHQRVAGQFRRGRVFLAGDAAHINNPLGGMGMNGGIHDALHLTARLAPVIRGAAEAASLDAYDRQRRGITVESIQTSTIQNKRNLEAKTPEDRTSFRQLIQGALSDPDRTRAFLRRIAMIDSLERAASL